MKTVYFKSELLFPHENVADLEDIRDGKWQKLVSRISSLPDTHEDSLAFSLMMIRLCGCLNCNPGSYKASLGCSACARRVIGMLKQSEGPLLDRFRQAKEDVRRYLAGKEVEITA
jgi:hypothetical protein